MFENGVFSGFAAAIIRFQTLLDACGIDDDNPRFSYQLSKLNPHTGDNEMFLSVKEYPRPEIFYSVEVPDGEWILSVGPKNPNTITPGILIFAFLGLVLAGTGSAFAWHLIQQPEKLNRLVRLKTSEIEKQKEATHTTLERISDAFIALDSRWCFTYVNKRAGEILGRDPDSMIGKNIWAEFPKSSGLPFYHACHRAMESQQYIQVEEYFEAFKMWFEHHIYPSANGLSIYFRDITAAKEASERLAASEKYFRTLIEKSTDGLILLNRDNKITFVSPSVERITGQGHSELISRPITEFVSPVDTAAVEDILERVTARTGVFEELVFRYNHKGSGHIWLEGTFTNHLENGSIQAIVLNFHEITHRIETEQSLREHTEEIQKLSRYLQNIREEERTAIAREIHDVLGQHLTALKMDTSWLRKKSIEHKDLERLDSMISLIDETIKTVRKYRVNSDPESWTISDSLLRSNGRPASSPGTLALIQRYGYLKRNRILAKNSRPISSGSIRKRLQTLHVMRKRRR